MHTLDRLVARIQERHPDFEIRFKDDPLPTWLRPVFWFQSLITKGFWERYTTTVGSHVYFPNREFYEADKARSFEILAHEFVHMHDSAELGKVQFTLRYLFPQVTLGVFGLLGFLGLAWPPLFALFALFLALAPWPAPWRTKYEKRGYRMSILARTMMGQPVNAEHIASQFTGRQYYWMSWEKQGIMKWVTEEIADGRATLANVKSLDRPYRDVHEVYYQFMKGKK